MSAPATTFAWEAPGRQRGLLAGMVALSVLAHLATFFLFRVVYPERASIAAPAPFVSVLDPSRPDHQTLLRLIQAEDPAPAAATHAAVSPDLLSVPYRPSYAVPRNPPRMPPETAGRIEYPPALDPVALIREVTRDASPDAPVIGPLRSRIEFAGPLAGRKLTAPAPIAIHARTDAILQPATFLIGVNDRGEIPHVFLQQTSGDSAVDEAAAGHLRALSFEPAAAPIVWAHAAFQWGADIYPAPAPAR